MELEKTKVLSFRWNQNRTSFSVGTTVGFYVYDAALFCPRYTRTFGKGIGLAEQLFSSNIVALLGGGEDPQFEKSKVVMWDEHLGRPVAELNFKGTVLNVLLSDRHVVVLLEDKIMVYQLETLNFLFEIETVNPQGIVTISHDTNRLLVCPAMVPGSLVIRNLEEKSNDFLTTFLSDISLVELSYDGSLLAVAKSDGAEVIVIETKTRKIIRRFIRGIHLEKTWSLSFSRDNTMISFLTSSGTAHFFFIGAIQKEGASVQCNSFAKLYLTPTYFDKEKGDTAVCHFSSTKGHVFVLSSNKKLHKFTYDENPYATGVFHQDTIKLLQEVTLPQFINPDKLTLVSSDQLRISS